MQIRLVDTPTQSEAIVYIDIQAIKVRLEIKTSENHRVDLNESE